MSITLSDAAAEHVKHHLGRQEASLGLRLGVKKTGCSGLAYVVDVARAVEAKDRVFDTNGVRVVIDEKSLPYIEGTHVDFGREGLNEGFIYNNPNVKSLCGCGESFGT
ncbi:MAG: HesB/IscA family protein [Gammaproteobacteria bacterium]